MAHARALAKALKFHPRLLSQQQVIVPGSAILPVDFVSAAEPHVGAADVAASSSTGPSTSKGKSHGGKGVKNPKSRPSKRTRDTPKNTQASSNSTLTPPPPAPTTTTPTLPSITATTPISHRLAILPAPRPSSESSTTDLKRRVGASSSRTASPPPPSLPPPRRRTPPRRRQSSGADATRGKKSKSRESSYSRREDAKKQQWGGPIDADNLRSILEQHRDGASIDQLIDVAFSTNRVDADSRKRTQGRDFFENPSPEETRHLPPPIAPRSSGRARDGSTSESVSASSRPSSSTRRRSPSPRRSRERRRDSSSDRRRHDRSDARSRRGRDASEERRKDNRHSSRSSRRRDSSGDGRDGGRR